MTYILFSLFSLFIAICLTYSLPNIVMIIENEIISQAIELKKSPQKYIKISPLLSLLLLGIAPILYWYDTIDIFMAAFVLSIAVLSYIDIVRNWVPDITIHIISWYSLICIALGVTGFGMAEQLLSAILYVAPFLFLNILTKIKSNYLVFASGDLYIALTIGLWSNVLYSISSSLMAILLAFIFLKVKKKEKIAFIPFMLPPFILSQII